jgi:hypothetical protein
MKKHSTFNAQHSTPNASVRGGCHGYWKLNVECSMFPTESGGGPPQSRTRSVCWRLSDGAKRLGVRQSSGALGIAVFCRGAATLTGCGLQVASMSLVTSSLKRAEARVPRVGKERQRRSSLQPRVARNELPWVCDPKIFSTPEGVEEDYGDTKMQPLRGWGHFGTMTQGWRSEPGRRGAPTLGWRLERRWRSSEW